MKGTYRSGRHYRVFHPDWTNPLDTSYSKQYGGRWNPSGEFGALYLNATLEVAAANARHQHRGRVIGLFDLKPDRRPHLCTVNIQRSLLLDVVNNDALTDLKLPATYPDGIDHSTCRAIGKRAYAELRLRGIACRSAAECSATHWLGEEVAWFDRSPALTESAPRLTFEKWYPDINP